MGLCEDMLTLITSETDKYIGDMPDTPNNLICIYETGGYNPEVQLDKSTIDRSTFMIRIRDTSYVNGMTRCKSIKSALNTLTNTAIGSTFYVEIFLTGGINVLGKDNKNRWEFTLNFRTRNFQS